MAEHSVTSVFPGDVRQFGFIVADLDAAIAQWAALGVAPWLLIPELEMSDCRYRGERSEPVISIALSNAGDMQIELIQQHGDTPSIYQEFFAGTGGGFNQVAYWVDDDDFDTVHRDAMAAGWTEVWRGENEATRFAYYEHPESPVPIVEVMSLSDSTRPMGDMIRQAAAAWAPGQPILLG